METVIPSQSARVFSPVTHFSHPRRRDRTATIARARAVPADGTPSLDAAYNDPTNCERIYGHPGVCWRYWQVVGDEIRVWTTHQHRSCVVIGSGAGRGVVRFRGLDADALD